jgi:hypothetical protein
MNSRAPPPTMALPDMLCLVTALRWHGPRALPASPGDDITGADPATIAAPHFSLARPFASSASASCSPAAYWR